MAVIGVVALAILGLVASFGGFAFFVIVNQWLPTQSIYSAALCGSMGGWLTLSLIGAILEYLERTESD